MIQKSLLIFCLSTLAVNTFAQQDSTFNRKVILKFNPLECLIGSIDGEIGVSIQMPVIKGIDLDFGLGKNIYENGIGTGYTIRAGGYHFINQKNYISLQFFYRRWRSNNIEFYNQGGGLSQKDAENLDQDPSNANDESINPIWEISPVSEGPGIPAYTIDNAIINVFAVDFLYGKQMPLFRSRHFVFEDYIGGGFRIKNISLQQISYQWDHVNYYTNRSTSYSTWVPDMKLGFMIGYKF
jgi:hypothetical protein